MSAGDPLPNLDSTSGSTAAIELRAFERIGEIERSAWNQLLSTDDNPFIGWDFLQALEQAGCVEPRRGWHPCHLTAWQGDRLLAAAPAYVKGDGMGDFSRDWGFAQLLQNLGGSLYPKLVVGVPFSPVTGRRILTAEGIDLDQGAAMLMTLARELAKHNGLVSIQVLYHSADERQALASAGLAGRSLVQYHWYNHDYRAPEDWLRRLKSKRRNQARRERAEPDRQGIDIRTIRGSELSSDALHWAKVAHDLYRTTCEKYMWGGAYLNRRFYDLLLSTLGQSVELVIAEHRGRPIAGAINLATASHLFGRYWGCHEDHRFLHFNVCLYHSIDECIERGIQVFEGGAGGEHKMSRGFEPTVVHCAQWFAEESIHEIVGRALESDTQRRVAEVERWHQQEGLNRPARRPASVG